MPHSSQHAEEGTCFDFSSPEGQAAISDISDMVMQVRTQHVEVLERKIALYERSFGLAVIPVLLRRAVIVLVRAARGRG